MEQARNNNMAESNKDISAEQLTQHVEDLSITNVSICANCGKEGNNLNICNKCKAATYCNASCKKKHRSKHKVACEKRVAEMHEEELERKKRAAELHDEKLFKQPPPAEDCPICMLLLPSLHTGRKYKGCCGKFICSGCIHAVAIRDGGVGLCPFCRKPRPTSDDEVLEEMKKRVEINDAVAIYNLGCDYFDDQDYAKALELWHQAAELGNATSYFNIGIAYLNGNGVERDEKKFEHYMELAAMGGDIYARHNLGVLEGNKGNVDRALRHYMIAAGAGNTDSLETIKLMFMNGHATKDDYTKALRVYQANLVEIKSPQRDEAAVAHELYKYY